ncbi:MAG: phospholipase D-like domain-containing protein [Gallionellaceae bacterium]|jgi:phosphatidylserine/phosphatidylglycerophosphate/cardiolipin synthase-like enzyme
MNSPTGQQNLAYHGAGWAKALADECAKAVGGIHISALSMLPPTPNATGHWPELWAVWCAAVQRGVRVGVWLPAPTAIHPATKGNAGAGRRIQEAGMEIHYITGNQLLHAKTCVIDARSVWIGSGNFTAAASHHNHEAYLRADCEEIARQLIQRWESLA